MVGDLELGAGKESRMGQRNLPDVSGETTLASRAPAASASPSPEVCVSRWWIVTGVHAAVVLVLATWLWVGLFSARLLVQTPLYLSGQTEWLAATKLVMGVPLYAGMVWVTWLLVRTVYPRPVVADNTAS